MGNYVRSNGKVARIDKEKHRAPHSTPKRVRYEKEQELTAEDFSLRYNVCALITTMGIGIFCTEMNPTIKFVLMALALFSGLTSHIKGE